MKLWPIVERIRLQVPALKLVGGAATFERAVSGTPALPAAFVLPFKETAQSNEFGNQIVQQIVDSAFSVVLAVRNLSDDEGAAAHEGLDAIRNAIANALLNWVPDGATDGCEFDRGELTLFADGVLWWTDDYRTAYMIRSA